MTPTLYDLKNLKKRYDGRTVLDLASLSLHKGKILVLQGPNGAGKTTLLEIMAFLSRPTSGEVWFHGQEVRYNGDKLIRLRRNVVLVQQHAILFTTTVAKNVEFPLKIRRTPKAARGQIVHELLDLVGMGAFAHARAHKLSAGETQRVAIAQALACYPQVILLDEPTANVDMENQIAIERIIRQINEEKGISVVFTTHDMIQASRVSDETVFLFEGRVAQSTYENIFSARVETGEGGIKYAVLQNGLRLRVESEKCGRVRLSIDPNALIISRKLTSEENVFKGRLAQLADEEDRVRALIDVGMLVSVLISKEVFKKMELAMGNQLWLTCPAKSIEVF
ncbi:MAG: ATP-binding cassette domain-containing protein [Thermodesulfobacteriota bacterium]|nr:ATP-binding cassette domain-containing protein [Thermodesulfobacteriota bacterium]